MLNSSIMAKYAENACNTFELRCLQSKQAPSLKNAP
jgi:hypothetical protein